MRWFLSLVVAAAGCANKDTAATEQAVMTAGPAAPPPPPAAEPAPMRMEEGRMAKGDSAAADEVSARLKPASAPEAEEEEAAAPSRSWFPETFLFEPLIVTDEGGAAKVTARVPDRLTTWRVLALAHSRAGAQAGAVTSFLGTLDVYVDPVVPAFLVAGDEVRLPVQVVNTTEAPVAAELRLSAENASLAPASARVSVPAGGSAVQVVTLRTARAGQVTLRAALGQADAVVRAFPVLPAGRAVTRTVSGTLAAPRSMTLETPPGSDPASSEVRAVVFPGAASVLRAELAGSLARRGVAEDAYALGLAGNATRLLGAFGDEVNAEAVRELGLVAGQRVIAHARTLDVARASLVAGAALAHPDSAVLARLGERALEHLRANQRPDGTFGGADGWTLQRLLVATAEGARAMRAGPPTPEAKRRAAAVVLRARGAIERNAARVDDAYTAAAILAAGAAEGEAAEKLAEKVRAALKARDDGARVLEVPRGVVRADGTPPSEIEATGLAALALAGAGDAALVADLGTAVLGAYRLGAGWGDGRTNLVCLEAVLRLYSEPVPEGVKVRLELDGEPVADGVLSRDRLREALPLAAAAPPGSHEWRLVAEPPVPGLAYSLALTGHVPWVGTGPQGGLELAVALPKQLVVGRPATVTIEAAAPSGRSFVIEQGLPAGVQVDPASLDELVAEELLESWSSSDGRLDLVVAPLGPGEHLGASYRVIPTLGGTLRAPASTLRFGDALYELPPVPWSIR
jgi:hypothetical protein